MKRKIVLKSVVALSIMLPLIHTTKQDNLISPHYDTFGNFLSPFDNRFTYFYSLISYSIFFDIKNLVLLVWFLGSIIV